MEMSTFTQQQEKDAHGPADAHFKYMLIQVYFTHGFQIPKVQKPHAVDAKESPLYKTLWFMETENIVQNELLREKPDLKFRPSDHEDHLDPHRTQQ